MAETLLTPKLVEYIQCCSAIATKAAQLEQEKQARETKAAALIPEVVEALVSNQCIIPELREKAASLLKDPLETLEVLKGVAEQAREVKAASMGHPFGGASQSATGNANTPFCGFREDGGAMRESRLALRRGLGLA